MEHVLPILAMGGIGLVAGIILAIASKKFSVPVDKQVQELIEALPGVNCGACGYASCTALAKALAQGEAISTSCIAGGEATASVVQNILGTTDNSPVEKKVAVVQCQGKKGVARERFSYTGVPDCNAAQLISGGFKACTYGCLGQGTCVVACPFDAIIMSDNDLPVIDEAKCTACGNCVAACPRNIITIIDQRQSVFLGCVTHNKLKTVKDACSAGCITCNLCVKASTDNLITMQKNNLPFIHWNPEKDLTTLMQNAIQKCPNKCFVIRATNNK